MMIKMTMLQLLYDDKLDEYEKHSLVLSNPDYFNISNLDFLTDLALIILIKEIIKYCFDI